MGFFGGLFSFSVGCEFFAGSAALHGNRALFAGITPLCYSLFALYDTQSRVWLPPNHLFKIGKDTNLNLLFRMR